MNKFPSVWGGGQLIAFSGIDGQTDFQNGLCLRTAFEKYVFQFKDGAYTPTPPVIRYAGSEVKNLELTGDFFRFYGEDGTVSSGVLPDSYHVLLDGDFSVELQDKYDIAGKDGKMLIGRKGFFDPALLELDVETEISKRAKFIISAPVPENISDAAHRNVDDTL